MESETSLSYTEEDPSKARKVSASNGTKTIKEYLYKAPKIPIGYGSRAERAIQQERNVKINSYGKDCTVSDS
jgi:hypothetical protein